MIQEGEVFLCLYSLVGWTAVSVFGPVGVLNRRVSAACPEIMRVGVFPVAEWASCESKRGRGALLYEMGRGRGVPVRGASYESELERSRGTPSS
jgi:hypothetical protein